MKNIWIIMALLFALLLGFTIGRLNIPTPINNVVDTAVDRPQEQNNQGQTGAVQTNTPTTPSAMPTEPVPVGAKLSEGQRAMLSSFGINPDTFVLTPAMIACAEAKIGTARMTEIQNGATPSFMEGASLVTCYK